METRLSAAQLVLSWARQLEDSPFARNERYLKHQYIANECVIRHERSEDHISRNPRGLHIVARCKQEHNMPTSSRMTTTEVKHVHVISLWDQTWDAVLCCDCAWPFKMRPTAPQPPQ